MKKQTSKTKQTKPHKKGLEAQQSTEPDSRVIQMLEQEDRGFRKIF